MNKKILLPVLMVMFICTAFTIGLQFNEEVSAAKWKKIDSGKTVDNAPPAGYKKTAKFNTYTKGDNKLEIDIYNIKKSSNKKRFAAKMIFTKKKGVLNVKYQDDFIKSGFSQKTKLTVKQFYKKYKKQMLKSTSLEKSAFDKKSFNINGSKIKTYALDHGNYIQVYIYLNGEEFTVQQFFKGNKKISLYEYNNKRKLVKKDSLATTISLKSIYKIYIDAFSNEINNPTS